ncbi:hypothetical protein L0337_12920 [candidate division KSB1 bacterium]|nr:hypothetical protein [candidate division KSB1 bacterium]
MIETISQAAEVDLSLPQEQREIEFSQSEHIASQITKRLKPIADVESAWLEDLGMTIYVYVVVNDFSNATLHAIFDAQYDVESEFWHISFHFRVNPVDLEQMQAANRIRRLF